MIKKIKILATATVLIALSGCVGAMPEYDSSKGSMIVFKTPTVRYADQGFVSTASNETKVEIYSNGQSVMRLRVTPSQVCLTKLACMSKKEFNSKVLGNENYPEDLIESVFRGEPIFNMENIKQSGNSFTQRIKRDGMDITYRKDAKRIEFNDTITGVKIKVISTN